MYNVGDMYVVNLTVGSEVFEIVKILEINRLNKDYKMKIISSPTRFFGHE
jgi:hypothetical protein